MRARLDWEGEPWRGVEPALSESDWSPAARLCMESDCVNLEFIRASRVTCNKVLQLLHQAGVL